MLKISLASKSARLIASTKVLECFISNQMSALIAGACEPVCPVEAIYYEDDVPAKWQEFGKINTEFFLEIGSPGGASKVGHTNSDHTTVVALPAKPE